ncbi:hypothetical protein LCGC14_1111130 [marine sediment metagenome]|uniref:Uncharacterized protein n=1 Tax=marine sediment metagenome TaxID=412755 RepID=A0A0F9PPR1_9ZZZZ
MSLKVVFIKEMDEDIWLRARIAALKRKKNLSQWMIEAIRVKLLKENG